MSDTPRPAVPARTGSAALWRRILNWPGGGGKSCGWRGPVGSMLWPGRRGIAVRVARTALLLVVCSVTLVMIFERRAIYHPTKAASRGFVPITAPGIEVEEVWLETADGVRIYGWFVDSIGTGNAMLYFHGNSGNLFERLDWILSLAGLGVDVMVIDYRGYGLSEGSPTELGLYADAEAAYRYLTDARGEVGSTTLSPPRGEVGSTTLSPPRGEVGSTTLSPPRGEVGSTTLSPPRGVPPERIVVYGKSLGGGPACEVARRHGCAGLILMSAFTNIPDIPVGWFTRERFDNLEKVAEIETPKLIIHSRADELVPFRMGEALYEAAAEPKRCLWFDEGGHSGLCFQKRPELLKAFGEFLEEVVSGVPPSTSSPDHPQLPRTGRRPP